MLKRVNNYFGLVKNMIINLFQSSKKINKYLLAEYIIWSASSALKNDFNAAAAN